MDLHIINLIESDPKNVQRSIKTGSKNLFILNLGREGTCAIQNTFNKQKKKR